MGTLLKEFRYWRGDATADRDEIITMSPISMHRHTRSTV